MTRRMLSFALAVAATGCATDIQRTPVAPEPESIRPSPSFMTHVQVQATPMGEIANSGVQLPAVSPDGQWIAWLEPTGDPVDPQAPLTGVGAERLSLIIQRVEPNAARTVLCQEGAVWPTFAADSRHLGWIVYNQQGRCDIALCDVRTRTIRRISPGFRRMTMPAVSPSGEHVAVVVEGAKPDQRRIRVVDVQSGQIVECPADAATVNQLLPQWTADGRIIYVLQEADATYLVQWGPGRFDPEKLATIPLKGSAKAAHMATVGMGRPLSGDDRQFAYLDPTGVAIALVDLQTGQLRRLPTPYLSGCWFDRDHFIAAGEDQMSLFADPDKPPSLLMRGPWLPRAVADGAVIALTRSNNPRALVLVRLKVTPGR